MHDQQGGGALRLMHSAFDREQVAREGASQVLVIAEQPDEQPAARRSVVDRVLRMLTVFADGPCRFNLSQLAEHTGLPLSTTHRLATQLVERGVLDKDDQGHYGVGPVLLAIASHTTVHDDADSDS